MKAEITSEEAPTATTALAGLLKVSLGEVSLGEVFFQRDCLQ